VRGERSAGAAVPADDCVYRQVDGAERCPTAEADADEDVQTEDPGGAETEVFYAMSFYA